MISPSLRARWIGSGDETDCRRLSTGIFRGRGCPHSGWRYRRNPPSRFSLTFALHLVVTGADRCEAPDRGLEVGGGGAHGLPRRCCTRTGTILPSPTRSRAPPTPRGQRDRPTPRSPTAAGGFGADVPGRRVGARIRRKARLSDLPRTRPHAGHTDETAPRSLINRLKTEEGTVMIMVAPQPQGSTASVHNDP